MTKRSIFIIPLVLLAAVLAMAAPLTVKADNGSDGSNSSSDSSSNENTTEAQKKADEQAAEQAKKLEEQRLEAAKQRQETLKQQTEKENEQESESAKQDAEKAKEGFQKACEANREGFKTRIEGVAHRAAQHIEVLNNIDDRVEAYVKKNNLTVANYDALLTAVKTQRQLVATLQTAAQQSSSFDCGTDKGTAQSSLAAFKDAFQQELNAIANYKTALKNLIAAVKAAAQTGGIQ